MRLARLDLTRFGKFTDRALDFPVSATDLHVVYGPNEAGKSTLRQALLDWLYGIHPRTGYDFKHGYAALEVGGVIEDPVHGPLAFRRFKRLKNALLDAAGQPLAEANLARWLAHTSRESFERMFAIDHRKLVAGEQSIMDANGDFGRMLFAAAAGVTNLAQIHKLIEAESKDLWGLPRRKEAAFSLAEDRFNAAKAKLKEVSLSSAQWKASDKALREAQAAETTTEAELATYANRKRQLERIQRVAAPLQRFREAEQTRAALGALAVLPDDADITFAQAEAARAQAKTQRDLIAPGLAQDQEEIAAITLQPALTARKQDITALAGRRGVFLRAADELPGVQQELSGVLADIAATARDLSWANTGLDAVAARLPSSVLRADLDGHLKHFKDLAHAVDNARRASAAKRDDIAALEAQLASAPDTTELPALNRALSEAQVLNYAEACTVTQVAVDSALRRQTDSYLELSPWQGTAGELRGQFPQIAEVNALVEDRTSLEERRRNTAQQLGREETAVAQAQAALTAHEGERDIVSGDALHAQREARDGLWKTIRRGERSPTDAGDIYEQEVRAADTMADARYDNATYIATARELKNTLLTRGVERDGTRKRLEEVEHELTQFDNRWIERVTAACGVFLPLAQYPTWATARETALADLGKVQDARQAQATLQKRVEAVAGQLQTALVAAGAPWPNADFPLLVDHALKSQAARSAAQQEQQGWRTNLAQARSSMPTLDRVLKDAEASVATWQARHDELMVAAGVPPAVGNEGAEQALKLLDDVEADIQTATGLQRRVAAMESEIASFTLDANALATACAVDLSGRPASDIAAELDARQRTEEQASKEHQRLTNAIATAETKLAAIATTEAAAIATVEPLFAAAKVETVEELRAAISRWMDSRAADERIRSEREAVINSGDGLAFDMLAEEVAAEDLTMVANDLEAAARKVKETEAKRTAAVEIRTKAQQALDQFAGQDTAVRLEGDRQDALLLMREAAEGHLKLALAAKLVAWAVNRYSERKHEPLLKAASTIFSKLTLGAFERLAVAHEDVAMTLYAYRPDGSHIAIGKGLSTGTEAQLYLALRLASLQQHLTTGAVLPFLGDDIFMGWDDERCAAGIEVLADLATRTQVILLTHSRRLTEIAEQTLPGRVSFTELPRDEVQDAA